MEEEKNREAPDDLDNIELINVRIESSFDESNLYVDAMEESFAGDETPAENPHVKHSSTDGNFDEQQLMDMVVVDDDDCSLSADVKDVKLDKKVPNNGAQTALSLGDKSEDVNENKPNLSKSPKAAPEEDILPVRRSLRYSLSNETFILQLDTSDALDSYLDKTANKTLEEKPISNTKTEGDMKENDSNQLNVPTSKLPEGDALILTADDELETELSLDKGVPKIVESSKATPSDVKLPLDTNADAKPKNESTKSTMEAAKKNDCLNPGELNKNSPIQGKDDNKSGSKKPVSVATSRVLWVSNVTQSVRAGDLKQYISKVGKVVTAKIVTDGKKCYGYVVMDNSDDANNCLKALNNAHFEGRKISLSFTRPSRADKKEDPSKPVEPTKKDPRPSSNESDDTKIRKSKERDRKPPKRHRSHSRSLSSKISKRQSPNDPLTTKFDDRKRARSRSKHESRKYLREKEERDRLQRNLLEEQRKNRSEMLRQIQREEKTREMEFRLEQERRKLQLERELFEKERRELTRLDMERRKIERERLDVLRQRSKLQEEIEQSRSKREPDKFSLSSVIGKPQRFDEAYDNRKEALNRDDEYNSRKPSNPKHLVKSGRDDRKVLVDSKSSTSSSHRPVLKTEFKTTKEGSKVVKPYDKSTPPPPPKLTNNFERKPKHSDRKHEYPESKPSYGERKSERGARKIEVIERKYYQERPGEGPDRKHERIYRKPEFEGRKQHVFPERKYEYGRDSKRYPNEGYPERDATQRMQWPAASVNYSDQWKAAPAGSVSGSSAVRYQEPNFPGSSYGGPSTIAPFYYHPTTAPQEYPRYDHCSQANGRKY